MFIAFINGFCWLAFGYGYYFLNRIKSYNGKSLLFSGFVASYEILEYHSCVKQLKICNSKCSVTA